MLHFVKSSALIRPVYDTNFKLTTNHLDETEIVIGADTHAALLNLNEPQRRVFHERVNIFFIVATEKLLLYLPFNNPLLRGARLLNPLNQGSKNFLKWVELAACNFPTVILPSEFAELTIEAKQYQLLTIDNSAEMDIVDFWKDITSSRFPLMKKLVKSLLTVPHSNADIERTFSNVHDIITDKRCSLSPNTVKSLIVIRDYFRSHGITCHSMSIPPLLIDHVQNARSVYAERLKKERLLEAEQQTKARAEFLQKQLTTAIEGSSKLQKLADEEEKV